MKRKSLALFLSGCLIVGCLCGCNKENTSDKDEIIGKDEVISSYTDMGKNEFVPCGENEKLQLFFNPSTTDFYVKNKADGSIWYACPENIEELAVNSKLTEMEMLSNLLIEYANTKTKKTSRINTYTASVKSGRYSISLLKNGVCFNYEIPEIEAEIPLKLYLGNDNLIAEIDTEDISPKSDNIEITSISVLPYFVSGTVGDEGYLFVPDGSGALIKFDSSKSSVAEYSRPIYGEEPTAVTSDYYLRCDEEAVYMPVYGARVNSSAVLAIISDGGECGNITARPCGYSSSAANVFVRYGLLNSIEHSVGNYSTQIYDKSGNTAKKIRTEFAFLSGDDADYSGMARYYGKYLSNFSGSFEKKNMGSKFYMDIYAGIERQVSTFGICHNKVVPLTTAGQVLEIAEYLKDNGVNSITARYQLWNNDEISNKRISDAGVASVLTSGTSFKDLSESNLLTVFPAVMSFQSYSGGGFIDHIKNASYSMTKLPFSWNGYSVSTLNETSDIIYRVSLPRFERLYNKFLKSYLKTGFESIALGDIGNSLYCDYRGEGYRRTQASQIMKNILEQTKENVGSIMLDSANAYSAVYADVIYNTPITDSNHDSLDVSVPFYTIALSGIAECVAPPLNYNNVGDDILLYALSAGASICYSWIYADAYNLQNTELAALSDVNYITTREKAVDNYLKISNIFEATKGSALYSHEYITDSLSLTIYENGAEVYVNFGDDEVILGDGTAIAAKSFAVKGGHLQ